MVDSSFKQALIVAECEPSLLSAQRSERSAMSAKNAIARGVMRSRYTPCV